MSIYKAQ